MLLIRQWLLMVLPFALWGTAMAAMTPLVLSEGPLMVASLRLLPAGLTLLIAVPFLGRNLNRINNERVLYKYNPLEDAFYKVKNSYFQENKNILDKISNYQNCEINN